MLNKKDFLKYASKLAFPIMIQNLIGTLVNIADTVMLGYVSQTAMSAMPFHLASLILQSQTKCLTILYFLSFYTFDTLCFGWHFCNTFVISPKEFICFLY